MTNLDILECIQYEMEQYTKEQVEKLKFMYDEDYLCWHIEQEIRKFNARLEDSIGVIAQDLNSNKSNLVLLP